MQNNNLISKLEFIGEHKYIKSLLCLLVSIFLIALGALGHWFITKNTSNKTLSNEELWIQRERKSPLEYGLPIIREDQEPLEKTESLPKEKVKKFYSFFLNNFFIKLKKEKEQDPKEKTKLSGNYWQRIKRGLKIQK